MVDSQLLPPSDEDEPIEPPAGLLALWLAGWATDERPLLFVARGERRGRALASAAAALAPAAGVAFFPPWDCQPYDRAQPSPAVMGQRMAVLQSLAGPRPPAVLVTTVSALAQRVPAPASIAWARKQLRIGEAVEREALTSFLLQTGYRLDDRVDEPGEAALRGAVIDLFPADAAQPIRLELDAEQITAIRRYDPQSQRSLAELDLVTLGPAAEALSEESEEPFPDQHALPADCPDLTLLTACMREPRLVLDGDAELAFERWSELVADGYATRRGLLRAETASGASRALLEPERLYLSDREWRAQVEERASIRLRRADATDAPPHFSTRSRLTGQLRQWLSKGERVAIAVPADNPLHAWLTARLEARRLPATEWRTLADPAWDGVTILDAPLPGGFALPHLQVVAGEQLPAPSMAISGERPAILAAAPLALGDRLVHVDHGIAELVGLETVAADGSNGDHAVLRFAGDQRLLVPVAELDRVWRYGTGAADLALDRLGGDAWQARRDEVAAEIAAAAQALADRVADRARASGPALPKPRGYERVARRFPFETSPDQQAAIEAVLADLGRGSPPMDRLVCGDVGYGKTEVALRAAAVAALNGRQVAVLAPTTLLVGQHLQTFRRRFAGLDLRIEQLSRLGRGKESSEVRRGLADGSVRIVIGTQALLSAEVRFDDLALVVIDEEQRFGAHEKEALARLRSGVHVLALSATPIPRTLQAALVGLRELTVLATPPQRRVPVRTFLLPFDAAIVREALLRERRRGGRSFVVVPRIADLEPMRERLALALPDFDLAVAHGRMRAAELDRILLEFASGEHDVLLTTSIVEAGLDIPGADTMVVWRPDRFGMAQLHQLRGRVGRGRERGACYLLHEPGQELPAAARRRLEALGSVDSLGAGFVVSAGDLDQRGGGSLLGEEQTGHLRRIGTGLYQHVLQRALQEARGEPVAEEWLPELELGVLASLPVEYVPEPEVRLEIYERLAKLSGPGAIDGLAEEVDDRFGDLPAPAANLFAAAHLRLRCRELGVARLEVGPKAAAATLRDGTKVSAPEALRHSGERLLLERSTASDPERIAVAQDLLESLRLANAA